jgi:hypothetical protein
MFLDDKLTRTPNRHVKNSPTDQIPVFKRTGAALVEVGGSILRYSTTTGETEHTPKPKRRTAAKSIAEIAAHSVKVNAGINARLADA